MREKKKGARSQSDAGVIKGRKRGNSTIKMRKRKKGRLAIAALLHSRRKRGDHLRSATVYMHVSMMGGPMSM
jgi:hypothetical protein